LKINKLQVQIFFNCPYLPSRGTLATRNPLASKGADPSLTLGMTKNVSSRAVAKPWALGKGAMRNLLIF